jgi:hypothetical protein
MDPHSQTLIRRWRYLLYVLQALVALGFSYGVGLRVLWVYNVSWHPHCRALYRVLEQLLFPMGLCFLLASVSLMFGSPFLIRSVGRVAIAGSVVGILSLPGALLIIFWR